MYYCISILLVLSILCILLFHFRKKRIIKKICCMNICEKLTLLDDLVTPFGYFYDREQDVFSSTIHAWQREYGYNSMYDKMSPFFNMVFDSHPVYFDYHGKTWLIEFWKGQYGINTGSEVGIYHADHIVPPEFRKLTTFTAASDNEMLPITTRLYEHERRLARFSRIHWWLTMFMPGHFVKPKYLTLEVTICFPNSEMRDAFVKALRNSGPGIHKLFVFPDKVSFLFTTGKKLPFFRRLYCNHVLRKNKLFCKLYCFVTRCFSETYDKVLYLYYYLPFAFRHMLRLKHFRR